MIDIKQVVVGQETEERTISAREALGVLQRSFSKSTPPVGYLSGLTQMRNAIADDTGCSLLKAELLVEHLEEKGHITYGGDTYAPEVIPGSWSIAA